MSIEADAVGHPLAGDGSGLQSTFVSRGVDSNPWSVCGGDIRVTECTWILDCLRKGEEDEQKSDLPKHREFAVRSSEKR